MARRQQDVCHMYGVKLGEETLNLINKILFDGGSNIKVDRELYVAVNHVNQCQGLLPEQKKDPVEFVGATIVVLSKNKAVFVGTFSGKPNGVILLNNNDERRQELKNRAFKLTSGKKKNRPKLQKCEKVIILEKKNHMKIPFWPCQ